MKIALIDVETTGLEPSHHEIIDIGCVIFEADAPYNIIDTLDLKVHPLHIGRAEPKALEINGYNAHEWQDAISLKEAMEILKERTAGCIFSANNMIFDWSFLRSAMAKTGIQIQYDRHRIDLLSVAWAKIPHSKMQGWSLRTICAYLGIVPEPKMHRGLQGAMKEHEVYCKLMRMV